MTADVDEPTGHRVGALIGGQADGLDGATHRRSGHHRHDGVEQPSTTARRQGAAHLDTHPHGEGEQQRRPHPAGGGQRPVPGGEDQQSGAGDGHRGRRDERPALGLVGHPCRQHGEEDPAAGETQQRRPGDDVLAGAGEHHQRQDAGEHRPR
ncbi:hypothetical protein [Geodermatophilus sp. SYSU D00700]